MPKPFRRAAKKTAPRNRETHTKARDTMTTQAAEPRGAGTGQQANATRDRKPKDTEYPKGDIAKGRIDPEALAEAETVEQIAMRDRRAYLIDQAEKNEAANDELNAIQVEQNKKVQLAQNIIQDPDVQREESMETAVAALKMHDPDERKKRAEAAQKNAASGRTFGSPATPDFKAGQASG
jgi:hypothetical protein